MSSFQDLGFFVDNNPETETQMSYGHASLNYKTKRDSSLLNLLGFCLKVIVNEKRLNLRKDDI